MPKYEIVPHLYLASFADTKEFEGSDVFVINCTKDLPMVQTKGGGTRLYVDDHPSSEQTMSSSLNLMVSYIHDHVSQGKDVVVHCFAGQQRSAAVVAAYLMKHKGMTKEQAIKFIKTKKPDAFLGGVHFMDSLNKFSVV